MSQQVALILAIFTGGGAGAVLRHYSILAAKGMFGDGFPHGTLFVNVAGSLLIGMLMELFAFKTHISGATQAMIVTGFLGGFTTFSTFSLDVYKLVGTHHFLPAALYVALSVFLALLAVFGGAWIMRGALS